MVKASLVVGVLCFGPGVLAAAAQEPQGDSAMSAFLVAARSAASRYQDRSVALTDGYRLIGPDFPSMGQHYVSIALVARGVIEPEHPQILEYVMVGDRPVLAGLAWALPRSPGESLPAFPPVPHAWHFHSGTVDDESFIASHAGLSHDSPGVPTLAVMHAWVSLANPDGLFATDNWALPWVRRGLAVPATASAEASRMLSLASGGAAYFGALVRVAAALDSAETRRIDAALARGASGADSIAAAIQSRGGANQNDVELLTHAWRSMWEEIIAPMNPADGRRLRDVLGLHAH
jgi:hypothetical protein